MTLCIVPAKTRSRRLPEKNIALLGGKPAICWTLATLLRADRFEAIVVTVEGGESGMGVMKVVRDYFPGNPFIKFHIRSTEMSAPERTVIEVVNELLIQVEDHLRDGQITIALATAVLMKPRDVTQTIALSKKTNSPAMIVVRSQYDPAYLMREYNGVLQRSKIPSSWPMAGTGVQGPVLSDAGYLYTFPPGDFQTLQTMYPPNLRGYQIPVYRAVDIDEEEDLQLARMLIQPQKKGQ